VRHVRSILYALVLSVAAWVLVAVGLTGDLTARGRDGFAVESFTGLLMLILGGAAYGILVFAPISPAGPSLAGVVFLGMGIWAVEAPGGYASVWPAGMTKPGFDVSRPGYGLAVMLAVPLLFTALNSRRWQRYEPPVLPIVGQIFRPRGEAAVAGTPLSSAPTTLLPNAPVAPLSGTPQAAPTIVLDSPTTAITVDEQTTVIALDSPTTAITVDEQTTVIALDSPTTVIGAEEQTTVIAQDDPTTTLPIGEPVEDVESERADDESAEARESADGEVADEPAAETGSAEQPAAEAETAVDADETVDAAVAEKPAEQASESADAQTVDEEPTADAEPKAEAEAEESPAEENSAEENSADESPADESPADESTADPELGEEPTREIGRNTRVIPLPRPGSDDTRVIRLRPPAANGETTQAIRFPGDDTEKTQAIPLPINRAAEQGSESTQVIRFPGERTQHIPRGTNDETQIIRLPLRPSDEDTTTLVTPPGDRTEVLRLPKKRKTDKTSIADVERPDFESDPTSRIVPPTPHAQDDEAARSMTVMNLERPPEEDD
jgi:hypothetical protein